MIIQVVCNGLFLFKLPSDFGSFQEKASILKESVKTSAAKHEFIHCTNWSFKILHLLGIVDPFTKIWPPAWFAKFPLHNSLGFCMKNLNAGRQD